MILQKSELIDNQKIQITGSKSISNRLLILGKLFGNIDMFNLSNSQDTTLLKKALESDSEIVDIHHAGTAMRFLTSYYSIFEGRKTILTGSDRMKNRPIKPLVDALQSLGADITYLEKEGFPPLQIIGKKLEKNVVKISANVSSQFLTSLILIGGKLENGLTLELEGEITSRPYLEMTLKILDEIGIKSHFAENKIEIVTHNNQYRTKRYEVESDWSSASYFYSLAAIGRKNITLKSYHTLSLQGDSVIKELYLKYFGINTVSDYAENSISLLPEPTFEYPELITLDMNDCPDIAQTLCVTATALKIPFEITGLHTLKVKETDRLVALQNELLKIGAKTHITVEKIESSEFIEPEENISIATYNDHRMAMAFAPFALIKELNIENEDVVEKSYPEFWEDFAKVTSNEFEEKIE
ncbi:3-phosphoshikimate 1-carboxyvinyltransferase [Epilithonimonas ginsengisoli]|uniref:3-phosphoshikimate 1-carboxyvinyltransferase n=1 Tax=Epilithonimonas ginsengisoli TaxID=1245592 RepID=A0ABU4JMV3_9FLAO|nr:MULTISPECIES: 3-phosphoshikimate 1-carboxyvinyltransferase [Chryseobacterium group]MBV6881925.1 3-phosphoshikimate 1-carboxyvinyltransferase [Epilithonimonas sp. FP105]MDW8550982.1 3-phosphoshikimate 1-carboxyvinyltransferase [Epilithonimonas ginsengisoli]OAH69410.1 3-phosphoshikimate 1-carboxyvinyltransferase [Chryseobacterium sp. FP211-J200]